MSNLYFLFGNDEFAILSAGFNQMAGRVAKDRFVLTVGNFSALDIFDDNAYAKDPRTQFLNWSNMAYTAYDYAADARGFGWGFAAEPDGGADGARREEQGRYY